MPTPLTPARGISGFDLSSAGCCAMTAKPTDRKSGASLGAAARVGDEKYYVEQREFENEPRLRRATRGCHGGRAASVPILWPVVRDGVSALPLKIPSGATRFFFATVGRNRRRIRVMFSL